jgi:two-component system, cell cycle response regulator DivK
MTTILIVEDNEMNRDMLSRRLEKKGYDILLAVDGQAGLDAARAHKPDLILMDLSLPVMDGWQATQRLKADAELRTIPVIALSAHAMATDRDKALGAGCDDFDTKPIDLPRLIGKINVLLAGTAERAS